MSGDLPIAPSWALFYLLSDDCLLLRRSEVAAAIVRRPHIGFSLLQCPNELSKVRFREFVSDLLCRFVAVAAIEDFPLIEADGLLNAVLGDIGLEVVELVGVHHWEQVSQGVETYSKVGSGLVVVIALPPFHTLWSA
jgi:hypothetical protein